MKKIFAILVALGLTACGTSSKQLKEAIEKDPSIVFTAIEKDPEKFLEVVNAAALKAEEMRAKKAAEEEERKRDAEFKNPIVAKVEDGRVIFGNKNAPVTIIEYSDFECPYCSRGYETMKEVRKAYGDKVRIVFKHLPLDFHPMAIPAAMHFEAVARQGHDKAEKFHDIVFEEQNKLKTNREKFLKEAARRAGANMTRLEKDLKDPAIMERIQADLSEAYGFNITGTPGFLVNGVSVRGAYPFSEFKAIIDRHLATEKK